MDSNLQQKDIDFLLNLYACSQKSSNTFQYASDITSLIEDYILTTSDFFIYSNGAWFNSSKQAIEANRLLSPSLYTDNIQANKKQTSFLIESYLSKIVIYCDLPYILENKIKNIKFSFTMIRNTLEKISRNQLANNFKHQIQHLKDKLHETQVDRQKALNQVYQTSLELKNPLTSIQGYTEIIKASIPATNEILRSIHYYADLVLSNTANIVKNINSMLKVDNLFVTKESFNLNKTYKYENLTAIIADSWQDNATLLKIILGTIGINCLSASTQEEIISLARIHNPDLILIDEGINHGKGIQTALLLRQANFTNTLIALSTTFQEKQHKLYAESGFNEVITKPLDKESLFFLIEKYFSTKNIYAAKNQAEIAALQLANNQDHSNPESTLAGKLFLKNMSFNISSLVKAQNTNDLLTMKKIINITRRASGSIGLIDMSSYADATYKAIEINDIKGIGYNLNLLLNEMKTTLHNQNSKQIS